MKCYYHPQVDAVGICKHCQKGLCPECAVDVGGGLACKTSNDNCQTEVKFAVQSYAANKRRYTGLGKAYSQWAILIAIPGIIFALFGLSNAGGDMHLVAAALLPIGIILLLIAIYFFLSSRNYPAGSK